MHAFFNELNTYDTALLAITVTLSGKEAPNILVGLKESARQRLRGKAEQLLQLESEPRIGLLVKTLKLLLQSRDLRGLERIDPAWIVRWLSPESPRLLAACLITLPLALQHSVIRRLPPTLQQALPSKPSIEALPDELLHYIRRFLERRIVPMPPLGEPPYGIEAIVHLERTDIPILIRDLGLIELAHAFALVGKVALGELLRRLPSDVREEVVHTIQTVEPNPLIDLKQAEQTLHHVQEAFQNPNELFFQAGLWCLAKGLYGLPEININQLFQRMPPPASEILETNRTALSTLPPLSEPHVHMLQDHILERALWLHQQGQIRLPWTRKQTRWHNEPKTEQRPVA